MRSIRKFFNDLAIKREQEARQKALIAEIKSAIEAKDVQAITDNIDAIVMEFDETILKSNYRSLLRASLRTADVEVFKAIYNLFPDPNYVFHSHFGMPGGGYSSSYSEPLLQLAIEAKASDIAVFIAEQPDLDISASSKSHTAKYHSGGFLSSGHMETTDETGKSLLAMAEAKEMTDVIAILSRREAELLTQQADKLNERARELTELRLQ